MSKRRKRRVLIAGLVLLILAPVCVAVGVYLAVGPSLACRFPARGPALPGDSTRTLISGGRERCYLLHVPPGYDPVQPVPVVLSFHGFAGTPAGLQDMAQWERVADVEQFLVIYPQGSSFPLRWNTGPIANIETVDDVQFVRDLLAELPRIAAVDPARIYVTGFSNGGTLAHQVACQLADRVAAIGTVSGRGPDPSDDTNCHPSRPVPVISFAGTGDPLEGLDYPAWFLKLINVSEWEEPRSPYTIDMWLAAWAQRNGCSLAPEALPDSGDAKALRYTGCRENAEVVYYAVEGGGHTWPGGSSVPGFGEISTSVDASQLMWVFFRAHPLSEGR